MTNPTPITPPPELVEQWKNLPEYTDGRKKIIMVTLSREKLQDIANRAAQWGADRELEACIEWLGDSPVIWRGDPEEHPGSYLREARRSKASSLKEQSLALIDKIQGSKQAWHISDLNVVRRALEALDD